MVCLTIVRGAKWIILYYLAGDAGQRCRPDDPRALGHRELLALGHGQGLSRRRMPRQNRQRASQFRHVPAHRYNLPPKAPGKDSIRGEKPQGGTTSISPALISA